MVVKPVSKHSFNNEKTQPGRELELGSDSSRL